MLFEQAQKDLDNGVSVFKIKDLKTCKFVYQVNSNKLLPCYAKLSADLECFFHHIS